MYEDVNVEFYLPLFYGLLFAALSFFAYSAMYLRQKRQKALRRASEQEDSEK